MREGVLKKGCTKDAGSKGVGGIGWSAGSTTRLNSAMGSVKIVVTKVRGN